MWKVRRAILAEKMGWTLEYIDGMNRRELLETIEILAAKDKASR